MANRTLARLRRWLLTDHPSQADRLDPAGRGRAEILFSDLAAAACPSHELTASFCDSEQNVIGYVQLHRRGQEVIIHRIWATTPGQGTGSMILKRVCDLADHHGVILRLKVNPLGAGPYPMSSNQLQSWYRRHGFEGDRKMTRMPMRNLTHA